MQMQMQMQQRALSSEAKEGISERLSHMEGLYFPRSVGDDASNPSHRKSILFDLLSRDAAVFLGTYSSPKTLTLTLPPRLLSLPKTLAFLSFPKISAFSFCRFIPDLSFPSFLC